MTTVTNKPNLIILRIPQLEEHPNASFVSAPLDEDGNIIADNELIETFSVSPGDAYLNMKFSQVVFAQSIDGGSLDMAWVSVIGEDGQEKDAHSLMPYELHDFVQHVYHTLDFDPPATAH